LWMVWTISRVWKMAFWKMRRVPSPTQRDAWILLAWWMMMTWATIEDLVTVVKLGFNFCALTWAEVKLVYSPQVRWDPHWSVAAIQSCTTHSLDSIEGHPSILLRPISPHHDAYMLMSSNVKALDSEGLNAQTRALPRPSTEGMC
jgi:hypothetical protein